MVTTVCVLVLFSLPVARADGWDDFSNNLATDLAPFLSLFGEQVTKQYLSESITLLDYFIFAMAPMGILAAVVSAIRVCGGPSLRAFIGRGQEGGGNVETELCSSTSRDVCERYHNGGIARVFGRPKILEVVYDPDNRDLDTGEIYTFYEYVNKKGKGKRKNLKLATSSNKRLGKDTEKAPKDPPPVLAFAPNLSLNIGITKPHPAVFHAVALGGLVLQAGVLVFAVIVTYYLQWGKNSGHPDSYACPLTVVGTVLVCGGMYWCAFLIGQSTDEQVWRRVEEGDKIDNSSIHWVQPGGQILGDQTFDAFSYSDRDDPRGPLKEYTISWKNIRPKDRSKSWEYVTWKAVGVTVSGFILQFIGLRGIHSAVTVAQLGVIVNGYEHSTGSTPHAALETRRQLLCGESR